QQIRSEFPGASHHCWAYLIGPPGATGTVGLSDDGEPHGTAGRPMLTVLTHCQMGDIAAVVTRFYGGTNLGKGGLVRAYSGGIQLAVERAKRGEHVIYAAARITLDYPAIDLFKRYLPDYEAEITAEEFGARVIFDVQIPEENLSRFVEAISELTNGRAHIDVL
ncbi:MAG: YigZ family protein, partial [bacterium]|nr:YigZ family protein [bacterium]